tara:strand:+ start:2507 stop:2908 length:402 start_codon:yes stop_codon:yes gene_type:complete
MVNKKKASGAGFILTSKCYPGKILGLVSHDGTWDLPKGTLDDADKNLLACAIRECYEECGILVLKENITNAKGFFSGKLAIFVAETKEEPKILRNFKTKIFEHLGYGWVEPEIFSLNTKPYIKKVIKDYINSN